MIFLVRVLLIILAALVVFYIIFIVGLIFAGKKFSVVLVAGLIKDCVVLFKNLMLDSRIPLQYKILVGGLVAYLLLPIDIVPDFIPIAGQLDDAIIVAVVLRFILKRAGSQVVKDNWRGKESTLKILFKVARIKYS